ncbi:unnamed protein product [Orchesella dallaii]|uniref:Factor VIII intron 22 protein n=1 Tax=Orchesella dallaii TaxID=48710 RepID=A0ABP1R965_9HEXA
MADIGGCLSPNNADFLPQFKAIGQGLKKRFFRKPNVAEAIEQYEELAQELQRENQNEFAAVCYIEASKCHEPLKNPIQQANLLLRSGRLYLAARDEQRYFQDDYSSLFFRSQSLHSSLSGKTQMAVQCLSQAASIYKRQNYFGLSVLVTLEVAEALYKDGAYGEALKFYRSALDTVRSQFTYIDQILVTEQMIRCKLEMTDYESSLKIINDTLVGIGNCNDEEMSPHFRAQFINRLEILRVCLLMLLGTNSVDVFGYIWPESGAKQANDPLSFSSDLQDPTGLKTIPSKGATALLSMLEDSAASNEVRKVQIQLKSLVIAVQHGSVDEIESVRSNLAPLMHQCHHDLFGMLIKMLS